MKVKCLFIVLFSCFCLMVLSGCNNSAESQLSETPIMFKQIPSGCEELEEYSTVNSYGYTDENGVTKIRIYSSSINTMKDDCYMPIDYQLAKVEDKNLRKKYCYKTANSYITTYFPSKIGEEKIYISGAYDLFFEPVSDNKSKHKLTYVSAFVGDRYVLKYEDVFSENSSLYLYPTAKGYRQEILLNNFDDAICSYRVSCNDLYCEMDDSGYVLVYDKEDNKVGIIHKPLVKDANDKVYANKCKLGLKYFEEDDVYIITFSLSPDDFKYPISISNSYSCYEDRQADTQIDSQSRINEYLSDYAIVSNNDYDGIKEICVKFSYTEKMKQLGIEYDDIESIEYHLGSLYSENDSIDLVDVNSYWCSSLTNWDTNISRGEKKAALINRLPFSVQTIDMTEITKRWGDNKNNWDNGMIISTSKGDGYTIFSTADADEFNNFIEITIK